MRCCRRYVRLVAAALAAAMLAPLAARAAIVFEFGQPVYDVLPSQTVDVPVSLRFDGADADALVSSGGLLSAAVRVAQTAVPSGGTATAPITLSANTTDFDDPVLLPLIAGPTATSAAVWEFADLTRASGVVGQLLGGGSRRVLLGTITFRGGTGVGVTTFQAGRYDASLDTTVTFNSPSATLDDVVQSATVSFNVPDPMGGGALLAMAAITAGRRRHRR
jgi:hypothetical protein